MVLERWPKSPCYGLEPMKVRQVWKISYFLAIGFLLFCTAFFCSANRLAFSVFRFRQTIKQNSVSFAFSPHSSEMSSGKSVAWTSKVQGCRSSTCNMQSLFLIVLSVGTLQYVVCFSALTSLVCFKLRTAGGRVDGVENKFDEGCSLM